MWLSDPGRQARFEREARVLASLNHPNIASIYGVHESPSGSGLPLKALVLELVEGETLADHIEVSVGGGTLPRWRRDGRELFYVAPDRKLMAVSVTPRLDTLATSDPRALFTLSTTSNYEPSADGQRFLVTAVVSEASPITVIMNWKPPVR